MSCCDGDGEERVEVTVPSSGAVVTEHAVRMSGGGYQVRNGTPQVEKVYPVVRWIADERQNGTKVYRRRVIVVEDWAEVTE